MTILATEVIAHSESWRFAIPVEAIMRLCGVEDEGWELQEASEDCHVDWDGEIRTVVDVTFTRKPNV